MKITVYHGGTEIVETPICRLGRENLDFGRGFYVTVFKEQAIEWAKSTAKRRKSQAIVNIYQLDRDSISYKGPLQNIQSIRPRMVRIYCS